MAGVLRMPETSVGAAQRLRDAASSEERDPRWLDHRFARTRPQLATTLRREVLHGCYRGDYHADVHDEDRLSQRVARGEEQVLLWGDEQTISRLSEQEERGEVCRLSDLRASSLGTHSVLPGETLYGPGHIEVARTGSISSPTINRSARANGDTATAAITRDFGRVLSGNAPVTEFHTISCLPRNRRSAPGVPGGAAIHRIHTRALGSSHWGLAPFYVMAGRCLELLDYRELCRDDEAVPRGMCDLSVVQVSDEGTAEGLDALCRLNGYDVEITVRPASPLTIPGKVIGLGGADPHGPRVTHARPDHLAADVAAGIADRGEACSAVLLDLESRESLPAQATLLVHGFVLTYLSPPKTVEDPRNSGRSRVPMRGGFVRIRTDAPLAYPYYLSRRPTDPLEHVVIDQYRQLVRELENRRSRR